MSENESDSAPEPVKKSTKKDVPVQGILPGDPRPTFTSLQANPSTNLD